MLRLICEAGTYWIENINRDILSLNRSFRAKRHENPGTQLPISPQWHSSGTKPLLPWTASRARCVPNCHSRYARKKALVTHQSTPPCLCRDWWTMSTFGNTATPSHHHVKIPVFFCINWRHLMDFEHFNVNHAINKRKHEEPHDFTN